jgi:hypothetical protein
MVNDHQPIKQLIMGDRYTLPAGLELVMSVSHFSFGTWSSG